MTFLAPIIAGATSLFSGGGLAAIGTGLSLVTTVGGLIAQQGIAKQQARIAEENAKNAIVRSQQEQLDQDNLTAAAIGEQIALAGSSGLSIDSRSFQLTRKTAAELGRKDALNVRHAGEVEAFNFRTQADSIRSQASSDLLTGIGGSLSSFLRRKPSLIGGSRATRFNPVPVSRPRSLVS